MIKKFCLVSWFTIFFMIVLGSSAYSQVELIDPSHRIYDFLDRMQESRIITDYSSSMQPISRSKAAKLLLEIKDKSQSISKTDRAILDDYLIEFQYDVNHTLTKTKSLFPGFKLGEIFDNKNQKYIYSMADSNAAFFIDGMGFLKYSGANGDSLGKPHLLLAQVGFRFRGTLFHSLGFYLRLSNGARLNGGSNDAIDAAFGSQFDPILASTKKFQSEGGQTFDTYEGYLRYATPGEWLSVMAGKTALKFGTGFTDQLVMSNKNSAPFSFLKLDLAYKSIKYTFLHGSLVGQDSAGKQLSSKYIAFHRFEFGPYIKNSFTLGFSEWILYSNTPVNFAMLNPLSFLTSAELNTELPGNTHYKAHIAIDTKIIPAKKLALQLTLLIADLNFKTLGKKDSTSGDNKFGYQGGLSWQDAFTIRNLRFIYEYTRIDPFVYSHREFSNSYSNWNLPIGAALNPNSDEHAIKLTYDVSSRLNLSVEYQLQHSGLNVTDSLGNVIVNVGSNILNGSNDQIAYNTFLRGNRVDRTFITAELTWQPIRQYFINFKYMRREFNVKWQNRTLVDNVFWGGLTIDY